MFAHIGRGNCCRMQKTIVALTNLVANLARSDPWGISSWQLAVRAAILILNLASRPSFSCSCSQNIQSISTIAKRLDMHTRTANID